MSDVTLEIDPNFESNLYIAADIALTQSANLLADIMRDEVPKGKTRKLEQSVVASPAIKVGDDLVATVEIGRNVSYFWALWKGIEHGSQIVKAKTPRGMSFHWTRWTTNDGRIKPNKAGYYVFQVIKRHMPPHDFIEKSLAKFEKEFEVKFSSKFKTIFK